MITPAKLKSLSFTERNILECLKVGMSAKEIGETLGLSAKGIKGQHMWTMYKKLGLYSVREKEAKNQVHKGKKLLAAICSCKLLE